ncbi:hypothetical protein ACJJTC_019423, partial [Scirpophaga incertulas]
MGESKNFNQLRPLGPDPPHGPRVQRPVLGANPGCLPANYSNPSEREVTGPFGKRSRRKPPAGSGMGFLKEPPGWSKLGAPSPPNRADGPGRNPPGRGLGNH